MTIRRKLCAAIAAGMALAVLAAPGAQAGQFNVLVFSKTAGWRHDAIPAGVAAIRNLGKLHDFDVFWTEDAGRVFNDQELSKYQAVVFLLTTGDILDDGQQAAFERYIRSGGGYVGVHSAADTEAGWPWYTRMVGHMFQSHPAVQSAVLQVEDRDFPGMERHAGRLLATDEWYAFGPALSSRLRYLLTVDETTYQPEAHRPEQSGQRTAAFHPVSWYQYYDQGRAFYTARGHLPATYGDDVFLHHLYGGIYWAATGRTFRAK